MEERKQAVVRSLELQLKSMVLFCVLHQGVREGRTSVLCSWSAEDYTSGLAMLGKYSGTELHRQSWVGWYTAVLEEMGLLGLEWIRES